MQRITPSLWFDGQAEEAANFYVSLFPNSKIDSKTYFGEAGPGPAESVVAISWELDGQKFMGINGGPDLPFTNAVSFSIECKDQAEIDHYWNAFSDGGKEQQCGWVSDKFGLSWQVVPSVMEKMISDPDAEKSNRVMQAMMQMVKLDIDTLEKAYKGN